MVSQTDGGQQDSICEAEVRAARALAAQGSVARALDRCAGILRACPGMPEALRLRGHILLSEGRSAEALLDLQEAARLEPGNPEGLLVLGTAETRAGLLDDALDSFDRCLMLDPASAQALASRAFVLTRQRRYDDALRDITRALELRPDSDGDLHNRAVVLSGLGRHAEAIRDYEHALEINPASGGTHNNLAWLLATSPDCSLRDGERAVAHARRAVEIGGEVASWVDTLAAALAESGDYEQAVRMEKRAYEMSEPRNERYRQLAEIYRHKMSYANWRMSQEDQDS